MVRIPRDIAKRVDGYVTKYMGILEVAGDRPSIKAYAHPKPAWLARTTPRLLMDEDTGKLIEITTSMDLQKLLFKKEHAQLLERVVAHELIHHRDFVAKITPEEKARIEALIAAGADEVREETKADIKEIERHGDEISDEYTDATHGPSFHEGAARINAIMGSDFVTVEATLVEQPESRSGISWKLAILLGVGGLAFLAIRRKRQMETAMPSHLPTQPSRQNERGQSDKRMEPRLPTRPPQQNERGQYGRR